MSELRTSEERTTRYSSATCACCGMVTRGPQEYHPYAACLMFMACKSGDVVRANLAAVVIHGRGIEAGEQKHTQEIAEKSK